MRFCENCGTGHECEAESERDRASDAVRIAEIERDKEIALARIQRGIAREMAEAEQDIAETQADAEVEAAVAGAEVIGAAIEAGIAPEPEPVIIDAPTAIAGDEPDDAPPPAEGSEGSEPPAAKKRTIGLGAW